MELNEILALSLFASFILLLFTGFPVAWLLGGLAISFTALAIHADEAWDAFIGIDWDYAAISVDRTWSIMSNWVLVALPMFIFMGQMLDRSGVAENLMKNVSRLFGRLRGGTAISVIIIGVLLAASTGIVGASVALLTMLALPVMLRQNYSPELGAGVVCAVGTLGILIPPSIMLVMMADQLSISVGDLFLGAVTPGILLGLAFIVYVVIIGWIRPAAAPAPEHAEPLSWPVVRDALIAIAAPSALIIAVLGSIFAGIATPTEASGVGAFGAMLLAWHNGKLNREVLAEVGRQTSLTTGFIFAILIGATAFSLILRGLGGDELIGGALKSLPFGPDGIIICILLLTFLLGFFLDWIEITLIILPLVAPVVQHLGFDLVWFTVLFAVCLQTSFLTPPVGFSLFYCKGVAPPSIRLSTLYKGVLPFILIQLLIIALVYVWPDLVTWLPEQAYGSVK